MNFAIVGVAGFVAPRHLMAIRDTGHQVVAAMDPHDSVGVLDQYFPDASFFVEHERFDRHIEKLRHGPDSERMHFLSICSPNHLHDAHIRLALRTGANAICEKPLVLNPWNLDALQKLEQETGCCAYTVMQLRLHPGLEALKRQLERCRGATRREVCLTYVTARGPWYRYSWKGDPERSGGLATNIGIHLFDLLTWLFGAPDSVVLHESSPTRAAGFLELRNADVRWLLSIDPRDLPFAPEPGVRTSYRSITIDGEELEFEPSADLHCQLYEATLSGRGFTIDDARASIELANAIRHARVEPDRGLRHPSGCTRV